MNLKQFSFDSSFTIYNFILSVLPTPLSTRGPVSESGERSVGRRTRPLNLRDLFVTPPFDELDAVASDGKGEPRSLSKAQLQAIKERG